LNYNLDWQVIIEALPLLWSGLKVTIFISVVSSIFAMMIGLVAALGRVSKNKVFNKIATGYVEFFRNTPLLVQIYIYYRGLPNIGIELEPIVCGILALSIYTGAYITEVVRSGIQSIAKEQFEAAEALGFSNLQKLQLIILPQAFRIVIPPLGNQFINLTKNSSLVSFITVTDIFYVIYKGSVDDFRFLEFFIIGCLIYMCLVGTISLFVNLFEYYLRIPGRA
jgi:His/Glu/Gln/Arg/opine family amino acid ABC transporter permease subunit